MALILKSSNFASRIVRFACRSNLNNSKNVLLSKWKNIYVINAFLKNNYSSRAEPKEVNEITLERSIQKLDLNIRHQNKVAAEDILEIIKNAKEWGSISYPQSLMLLRCCGNLSGTETPNKRMGLVHKVWSALEELGVKFDIFHYNTLLSVYLENDYKFSPMAFLKNLEEKNITPNLVTYQRLLRAFCQQGDISGASFLLEEIKNKDLPLNEDIFNSLIYGHCQLNDLTNAYGILELMKQKGINPSVETYLHFFCGNARTGNIEEIRKLFKKCQEEDIVLMDKDLFEILYTLAVNGHEKYFDEIMEKITCNTGYAVYFSKVFHRLMQKNFEDAGIKIFFSLLKKNVEKNLPYLTGTVIDHYCCNCSAKDVLEICSLLDDKVPGISPIALALKTLASQPSTVKYLDFLSLMKNQNLPLRPHYFWPAIVKNGKIGNRELCNVLQKMKQLNIRRDGNTVMRFVVPNYQFGADWKEDLENLKLLGITGPSLNMSMVLHFLNTKEYEKGEKLAASSPLGVRQSTNFLITTLATYLKESKNAKSFVNILYNILHDIKASFDEPASDEIESDQLELESEPKELSDLEEQELSLNEKKRSHEEKFIHSVFNVILKIVNEELLASVLKEMLARKIRIPESTVSTILGKSFSEEVKNLAQQLNSPNLKIKYDENLLQLKSIRIDNLYGQFVRALLQNDIEKAEELQKTLPENCLLPSKISLMIHYAKNSDFEKVMELCRNLKDTPKSEELLSKSRDLFRHFLNIILKNGQPDLMLEVIKIGEEVGVVTEKNFHHEITAYIAKNDLDKAVEVFCDKCNITKSTNGFYNLAMALFKAQKAEALQKIVDTVSQVRGENFGILLLVFTFSSEGLVKETKKLLATPGLVITRRKIQYFCQNRWGGNLKLGLKTFLEATKGLNHVNKLPICESLLSIYAAERNVEEAKELMLKMSEENISPSLFFMGRFNQLVSEKKPVTSDL